MTNESVPPSLPATASGNPASSDSPGAAEVAKAAAGKASDVAGAAVDNAKNVAAEASSQAKAVVSQAKGQVQSLAEQTKGELMTQAETKGQQAASGLRTLSEQIAALAEGRPGDAGPLTHLVQDAQHRVSALASRIDDGGPQGVLEDVTSFARRRPGVFLLGAIGAGFLAGRLVRSGTAAASEHEESDQIGSEFATTPGIGYPTASFAAPALDTGLLPGHSGSDFTTTTPGIGYPSASPAAPGVDAPAIPGEPLITPPSVGGVEGLDPVR
jgi:hypothetical protein